MVWDLMGVVVVGVGCDRMIWDEMILDGNGWDGMGLDGMIFGWGWY